MNVQENVCFVSKLRYLNVQKSPGHTIQQPAVGGGTVAIQQPAEFVRFKDHRCLTNSQEVIDFLRNKITESPELGLREIKIKTKQEEYEDEMAKLQEQFERVNAMKLALNPGAQVKQKVVDKIVNTTEETAKLQEQIRLTQNEIESAKTVVNKPFHCWLGKCQVACGTLQGLQKHLNDFHRKHMKKENIVKKLNELAKEEKIGDVQASQ